MLATFCEETVGQLVAYDLAHRSNLIATLDAYRCSNRNVIVAARSIYVHHNTFRKRLRLIREVIGPFADDAERCLSLALALRIRRLLTQ